MAYVVVVFAIINTAALLFVVWLFWTTLSAIPEMVETAIQDEVRRQDDRIEKRAARAAGPAEDAVGTSVAETLRPGIPLRR